MSAYQQASSSSKKAAAARTTTTTMTTTGSAGGKGVGAGGESALKQEDSLDQEDVLSPLRATRLVLEAPNTADGDDCIQEAQRALMERVAIDVAHVVSSLRDVWNEVGYSVDERRLQMDKMSDELTQTLRAKLACEVEVRDVFKKDIVTKVRECEELARALDCSSSSTTSNGDSSNLMSVMGGMRLSHALMRIEEEHSRLATVREERVRGFKAAHSELLKLSQQLEHQLDPGFARIGSSDLSVQRLEDFQAEVQRLLTLERERSIEIASLSEQCRSLRAELTSSEAAEAEYGPTATLTMGVGKAALFRCSARLEDLKYAKIDRLSTLKSLGDDITLLWSRLGVKPEQMTRFRDQTREYGISQEAVDFGAEEKDALRKELKSRVVDLVVARRKRMTELWDEMEIAPEARASFAPCAFVPCAVRTIAPASIAEGDEEEDDLALSVSSSSTSSSSPTVKPAVFDESTLAAHDEKLAELEKRRSTLQPLLRLVEKLEELVDERKKLEQIQADPSRLTRRGPGAAAERKAEMDAERNVKQLPKIVERLAERINDWEKSQGVFIWKGQRYANRMAGVEVAWNAKKAAQKLVKTARKDAQSKKENFPNHTVGC